MGYATVRGKYHKGPKKNTKRRARSATARPTPRVSHTDRVLEDNRDLIKALAGLNPTDLATFVKTTAGPNPTGCTLVVHGGEPSGRHSGGGMAYVASLGGGHGGTGATFPRGGSIVAVVPNEPTTEPKEEIVGYIVRKPNGEMVLRFK
jgi:hypothetical protein